MLFSDKVTDLLLNSTKADIGNFMAHWLNMSKINPDAYPLDLTEDEWLEQFYGWLGV